MDSSSFDEIFRRFQSVTGTSTQQELYQAIDHFRIQKARHSASRLVFGSV